ncbi:hypothetical protein [Rugamonas sp.]|uniref:hypothetical protein n=1 Tax=Rugamonas sp. TaxID=1926287 RepID=UPI0025EBD854|nr:hypothetical protein [Rugamonas sp.]
MPFSVRRHTQASARPDSHAAPPETIAAARPDQLEEAGVDLQAHCGFHSIPPSILFCFPLFRPAVSDEVQKLKSAEKSRRK